MKLELTFGALVPSIKEQLKAQSLTAPRSVVSPAQHDADAITRLVVRGILSDGVARRARRKILRAVLRGATTVNGETVK